MSAEKHRVAWFSPLNQIDGKGYSDSVSAYVSDELLPLLKGDFEIECFIDGFGNYPGFPTHHYLSAAARHEIKPYDIFFYQIEDHPYSGFTRAHIGLHPGVTLLHDLLFKLPGPEPFAFSPWRETAAMPYDESKPFPKRLQAGSESRPVGKREATFSVVPIFSSSRNLDQFGREIGISMRAEGSKAAAYKLPFPVRPFDELPRKSGNQFTVGFCGTPLIEHRAHKLLEAISGLSNVNLRWLLNADELVVAKELCSEFGVTSVEFELSRSPEKWRGIVPLVDCAVHSLFSVFGSPGPYLQISMAAGTPCIVTRFAETELLPNELLFKIPPGKEESRYFEEVIRELQSGFMGSSRHAQLRSRQVEFSSEFNNSRAIASHLKAIFFEHAAQLAEFNRHWSSLEHRARGELLVEGGYKGTRLISSDPFGRELSEVFNELGWVQ